MTEAAVIPPGATDYNFWAATRRFHLPGVFLNEEDYNFDIALRRFKKQVEKAGILSEMKKRQHYEKPSVMRKKKKAAARKRLMKKMRKMNMA